LILLKGTLKSVVMTGFRRRSVLRRSAAALAAAAIAGCTRGPDSRASTPVEQTDSPPATDSPVSTPTGTPVPCERDGSVDERHRLTAPFNARGKFRCRGEPLDDFEDLLVWKTYEGSLEAADGTAFAGSQSAGLVAAASDKRVWIYRRFDGGLDLAGRDLSLAVRLDRPASRSVVVQLLAPDRENQLLLSKGLWRSGWTRHDLGPTAERGSPDLADGDEIRIQFRPPDGESCRAYVDSLRTTPRADRGAVVLTFDDNGRSQYETAFPILREYGFPGAVAVIPDLVGNEGHIPLDGMREMRAAGWEMASHPQRDRSLRAMSTERKRTVLQETKRWLVDEGFGRGAQFVVWPYGQYDREALELAGDYHRLGFAGGDCPVGRSLTGPIGVSRVTGDDPAKAEAMIDRAARYNQLVVLTYHSVGNSDDDYISESEFEEVVAHLDEADVDVVTPSEVWADQTD
jgi:peptidoglycan/xylan/chitin deacetylase (PgdA/CDA1 family)